MNVLRRGRYTWDYVMVFEVRAEDKELTSFQRRFSMKEILTRLNAGGEPSFGLTWLWWGALLFFAPGEEHNLSAKEIQESCTARIARFR